LSVKSGYTDKIDNINTQATLLRQIGRDSEAKKRVAASVKEAMTETATPKDIVSALVDRVLVFPNNRLEIHWKFEDFTK